MRFLLVLSALICSLSVSAKEYRFVKNEESGKRFIVAYKLDNHWVRDEYFAAKGEFQQKVSSKIYENFNLLTKNSLEGFTPVDQIDYKLIDDTSDPSRNRLLWKAEHEWSTEWEHKYAQWIRNTLNTDFFVDHGIETDCADVIIGLRWIFSRIHKLPVANRLAGSEKIFSNEDILRSWKKLKTHSLWHKDILFLTALNYIMDNTFTHSLWKDSFPVKISAKTLIEGTFYLNLEDISGHVRVVAKTNYFNTLTDVPLIMRASTVPRGLRRLSEEVFLNFERPDINTEGFRAMRWPIKKGRKFTLKESKDHTHYGENQYDDDFLNEGEPFALGVFRAVRPGFSKDQLINEGLLDIIEALELRRSVVEEGHSACNVVDCSPGTNAYEAYSTPSRDGKIRKLFEALDKLVLSLRTVMPDIDHKWEEALRDNTFSILNKTINMYQVRYMFKESALSYDPRDPLDVRWVVDTEGLAVLIKNRLSPLILEREERINERGECKKDCFPKGAWYWDANTYELDKKIAQLNFLTRNHCNIFPAEDCLKDIDIDLNGQRIEVNGANISLLALNERIPFFNSDPRLTTNFNWGEAVDQYFHLPSFQKIELTDNGFAVLDNKRLFNLLMGTTVELDTSGFVSLNPHGLGFIKNGLELLAINESGTVTDSLSLQNDVVIKDVHWKGAYAAVVGEKRLLILERRDNSLLLNLDENREVEVLDPQALALLGENGNDLIFLSDIGLIKIELGKVRLWDWKFIGMDSTHAVIRGVNKDGEGGYFVVNLLSRSFEWVDKEIRQYRASLSEKNWLFYENDELVLGAIDGSSVTFRGSGDLLAQNSKYITLEKDHERTGYRLSRGLTKIEPPARSMKLAGIAGPLMGWENDEGMIAIYRTNGSKLGDLSKGVQIASSMNINWASFEFDSSHGQFEGQGGFILDRGNFQALPAITFHSSIHLNENNRDEYLNMKRMVDLKKGVLLQTYPGVWSWIAR